MSRGAIGFLLALFIAAATSGCQLLEVQPPPAPGAKACIDVPAPLCEEILQGRINERAPVALVGYRITCNVAACTSENGDAEAALTWADGMTETFDYLWAGARE